MEPHILGVECGAPPTISHSSFSPVRSSYNYGVNITYRCLFGYELENSVEDSLACGPKGSWDGNYPTCKGKLSIQLIDEQLKTTSERYL